MSSKFDPRRIGRWLHRRRALTRELQAAPLTASSVHASLARWRRLDSLHRRTGAYPVIPYVGGAVLAWPPGIGSVAIQAKFGLGEFYDQSFCLHVLRPEDLFCDAGANAGVYTVLASKAVGARTIAFEPVPKTFNLLMQNVWANGIAGLVEAHQCGLGRTSAELRFTSSMSSYNHVTTDTGETTVGVPVEPLDAVLAGRVPRVIKIDVEGFEAEVIAGATRTLDDPVCAAVIMELVDDTGRGGGLANFGVRAVELRQQMIGRGFAAHWYDPGTRRLVPVGVPKMFRWNQIFVRDVDFVRSRIENGPVFHIRGQDF